MLVNSMQMNEDFDLETLKHEGVPTGAVRIDANGEIVTHAMVVIGTKRDPNTGKVTRTILRFSLYILIVYVSSKFL